MVYEVYNIPNIKSQFKFQKEIKKKINDPVAFCIDNLENWSIDLFINLIINENTLRTITLCSKYNGKLFAIGSTFLRTKLWFIDSSKGLRLTEQIDNFEFLILSRY